MSLAEMLLPEFDAEMANTRQVLAVIPDELFSWQARPTMQTIGWVASHLVEIPGWVGGTIHQESWDLKPVDGEPYKEPAVTGAADALRLFDASVAEARGALQGASDETLLAPWSLLQGGQVLFTMPRLGVIRTWVLNHTIHHRAFLIAYLRMNGVAVPGMYGPGA